MHCYCLCYQLICGSTRLKAALFYTSILIGQPIMWKWKDWCWLNLKWVMPWLHLPPQIMDVGKTINPSVYEYTYTAGSSKMLVSLSVCNPSSRFSQALTVSQLYTASISVAFTGKSIYIECQCKTSLNLKKSFRCFFLLWFKLTSIDTNVNMYEHKMNMTSEQTFNLKISSHFLKATWKTLLSTLTLHCLLSQNWQHLRRSYNRINTGHITFSKLWSLS